MGKQNTSDEVSFGQLVGSYRTLRISLTQKALAGLIGISEVALYKWEADESKPGAKNLQKLLEVFLTLNIFTARKEEEEARALWKASGVNVVFDEVWVNALTNARKAKSEKRGQVASADPQSFKLSGPRELDRDVHQNGQSDQRSQALSSTPLETDQDSSQLDLASLPPQASASSSSHVWFPKAPTLRDFVVSDITRCLLQIAHTDYSTSNEMTVAIQAAIKEFNRMKRDNLTFEITRRDAMCELASVPWIALGQKQTLSSRRYEEMLRYCTAALEACWELYRGNDPIGTRHAFDCVCTYMPILETIARDSVQYRKEALHLTTQYALLQTMFGWGLAGRKQKVGYAQNALFLSKEGGDIFFQLSAYPKLSLSYITSKQPTKAWETMQEGEHVLKEYRRMKKGEPLPSGLIGNFYSGYSMAQISNGISPDTALGIATDSEPLKEHIAFTDFTASNQWWEAAWTCSANGDSKRAMIWLEKLIDTETLAPLPNVLQSERERVGVVNVLTKALLQSKDRDMGRIIPAWTAGMEGAQALKNEARYDEAITNFEIMRVLYPGEQAILKLLPLTAHWSEEKVHTA